MTDGRFDEKKDYNNGILRINMEIKEFWLKVRAGELLALLEYLIEQKVFDFLTKSTNEKDFLDHYGFVANKFEAVLSFLEIQGLIKRGDATVYLTPFSQKYLTSSSQDYIGDYVLWKVRDFENWRKNLGKVFTGEQETVHSGNQYETYLSGQTNDLEGVVLGCARVYPREESARIIAEQTDGGHLLDVACGSGLWGLDILKSNPNLALTGFDSQTTSFIKILEEHVEVSGRVTIQEGDMFKDRLPEADYVLMANTLMDWSDEEVELLISKALTEVSPKKLFIHEFISEGDPIDIGYNLLATIETRGRTRPLSWWRDLLAKHGKQIEPHRVGFGSYLLVCR